MANRPCDPLTVVASCNRWLPRWGPASGEQWPWQLRVPDGASLEDWRAHRPPRDSEDTWWYPVRLRDLQPEEVHTLVERQLHTHPGLSPFTRLTPFIHRLTGGLPKGASQVLQALQHADGERTPGPAQERWLRTLPDRTVLVGEVQRTLADAALDSLLEGFDDRERDRLAECAAAPDLYVGTQVLGYGEALFTQLRIRRLIDGPGRSPRASTRGCGGCCCGSWPRGPATGRPPTTCWPSTPGRRAGRPTGCTTCWRPAASKRSPTTC